MRRSNPASKSNGRRKGDPGTVSQGSFIGAGNGRKTALWQAVVVAVLLVWWSPVAASAQRDCLRPAKTQDLRLDVKDDVASIVIANVTDHCSIFFVDPPQLPGDTGQTGMPGGTIVRLTAPDGRQLSITNPGEPTSDGWFPGMNLDRAFDQPRVTLRARERRVFPMNLANIVREIAKEKVAAELPDLPWGKTIFVQVSLTLLAPNDERGGEQIGSHKAFKRFKYDLPERAQIQGD